MLKSLLVRNNELSQSEKQLEVLSSGIFANGELPTFKQKIQQSGQFPLKPKMVEIFQINVGYMCNQVCAHCHVDAGPDRKEIMEQSTFEKILSILKKSQVHTLDITGGAPEMNPHFRWFIDEVVKLGIKDIIVRSNLTIILANPKYHDLPEFFAKNNIHVVSSLPFYKKDKTDKQRGDGVFEKSIIALQMLNKVGYGNPVSGLKLDLVFNPSGAFLPGNQLQLENEYKKSLFDEFGIVFNQLFTITNLPISRFLEYLLKTDNYEDYMYTLVNTFNPAAVNNVMCKNTISVGWDGALYDCDFNQMLKLKVASPVNHIDNFVEMQLIERDIVISQHCYGCTAGAGSSCQGAVV